MALYFVKQLYLTLLINIVMLQYLSLWLICFQINPATYCHPPINILSLRPSQMVFYQCTLLAVVFHKEVLARVQCYIIVPDI